MIIDVEICIVFFIFYNWLIIMFIYQFVINYFFLKNNFFILNLIWRKIKDCLSKNNISKNDVIKLFEIV